MGDYVASVCRSTYYRLRQIRPTVQSLTPDGSKTLVQAFISERLDYCNSLLYEKTDSLFQRIQSVQNAAARLITELVWATDQLLLPDHRYGTVCRQICA